MRQTPLSSMVTQPRSRAAMAMSWLISSVADMNAMSDSSKTSGVVSSTEIRSSGELEFAAHGPGRGGQPQPRHREVALREHFERDGTDGACRADDGDSGVGHGGSPTKGAAL